ncbi:MAG TPA: hypothetical protein VHE35_21215 [Kofleriaceae bacterium]|nr:hypothetical protein [Kofleriaceae bacterium]
MLDAVGYWFNERAPSLYPRPQRLVGDWDPRRRAAVLAYLRAGDVLASYRARSFCRFACGEARMGHRDLTDGRFAWPEGLAHYVERHAVRLPDAFVAHALGGPGKVAVGERRIDDAPWIAWGRANGAVVEQLDGWDRLSWADEQKVLARLGAQLAPGHPLFDQDVELLVGRRATDELLLALPDGRLALVTLTGAATTVFAGWDAWPPPAPRRR